MAQFTVKLIKKEEVAQETMAFYFKKPEGFSFTAGQFGDFTLLHPSETDDEGNTRGFSLCSAPYEKDIMVATRMRNTAFKRVLRDSQLGTEVKLDASYGNFILHKTSTVPAVFLTGGIGITPVRSIIAQATYNKLSHKIFLFYANKTPADAAFLANFSLFVKENPNFKFIPVMTRTSKKEWHGESGYITKDMLEKYIPDFVTPIFYLSGPASMVTAMRSVLMNTQVNEDNIKTEEFTGY